MIDFSLLRPNKVALQYQLITLKKIKDKIAGPNKFKLLINISHSLVNAPIIITINKIVEILFAIGKNEAEKS